jgi:hypothetical protein
VGNNRIAGNNTSLAVNGMATNGVVIYAATLKNGVNNGSYVHVNDVSDGASGLPAFTSLEATAGFPSLTIANISSGNNYRGNIQIGEVMVFNVALSDAARRNAEVYLKEKWLLLSRGLVNVADGAVLDCGGASQALTSVSGGGTISNGTLTVTEALVPAGDGIGIQRVSNLALKGTLRVNVTADGACDQLVGTGSLSVSGLTLQVADLGLLNRAETYTVAAGFDALTDEFAAHNLPENWHVRYDQASGAVTFYYSPPGTLIKVR